VTHWLGYLVTGIAAGLTAGLLGVGGGVVTIPFLDVLWTARGADAHASFAVARGTSLAIMAFTSLSAAVSQWRRGAMRPAWAVRMAVGGLAGALAGSLLAVLASPSLSRKAFGVFALFVAVQFVRGRTRKAETGEPPAAPIGTALAYPMGAAVGVFSSFFGVGGGILAVPLLQRAARATLREAVATSSTLIVGLGAAGAASFAALGLHAGDPLPGCVGYVDPVALLVIAAISMIAAPAGVALAHRLPPRKMEIAFALYAAAIGAKLLLA
jgi:uncharacterized membrane protein YfcA